MNAVARDHARRRGDPLIALAVILTCWIGARALAWDRPGLMTAMTGAGALATRPPRAGEAAADAGFSPWPDWSSSGADSASPGPDGTSPGAVRVDRVGLAFARALLSPHDMRSRGARSYLAWTLQPGPSGTAVALDRQSSSARSISPGGNAAPFPTPTVRGAAKAKRWSGDAWLLARNGNAPLLAGGPAPASYGASQTGAVIRYEFAPSSRYHPAAYARINSALGGVGDAEVALGLSARPLPSVPVIALGEVRANRASGKLRFRPAVMLVTQLPPFALPLGMRGEAYAQGGYVAGTGATPFFDGQLTFDRPLTRLLGHQLKIGGGIWGGAQRGAARLDVGPSTRVDFRLNHRIAARLALDYRLHVAGNAKPGSGPALTVSAGF